MFRKGLEFVDSVATWTVGYLALMMVPRFCSRSFCETPPTPRFPAFSNSNEDLCNFLVKVLFYFNFLSIIGLTYC